MHVAAYMAHCGQWTDWWWGLSGSWCHAEWRSRLAPKGQLDWYVQGLPPSLRFRILQKGIKQTSSSSYSSFSQSFFKVLGVHEERREEEGLRERESAGHGFLTFWTVTCAHDGHVLMKTSLQKGTFFGSFKGFYPK